MCHNFSKETCLFFDRQIHGSIVVGGWYLLCCCCCGGGGGLLDCRLFGPCHQTTKFLSTLRFLFLSCVRFFELGFGFVRECRSGNPVHGGRNLVFSHGRQSRCHRRLLVFVVVFVFHDRRRRGVGIDVPFGPRLFLWSSIASRSVVILVGLVLIYSTLAQGIQITAIVPSSVQGTRK